MNRTLSLAAAVALAAGWLAAGGRADEPAAVPAADAAAKAEKEIKDLFKKEYAAAGGKVPDRKALAEKLLQQGLETKDEPVARFVCLREARDLAARAGAADVALEAAGHLQAAYKFKPFEPHLAAADLLVSAVNNPANARAAADDLLLAADAARQAEDYEAAVALAKAALVMAKKGGSADAAATAQRRVKRLELVKAQAEATAPAAATLAKTPGDPDANLAVGKLVCLYKLDWAAGTDHLLKGSDEGLRDAARKDAAAVIGTEAEYVAAADAWYDLADKADADTKPALQARAHGWYAKATATAAGLTKAKAEKRLAELQPAVDALADRTKFWTDLRKAIADKKVAKESIVGGAFHDTEFEEVPPEGAVLVGFRYSTSGGGKYPGALQPIFSTSRGTVMGNPYAVAEKGAQILTVKAKPGYAVGALEVRGGGGIDSLKPVFMKMTDTGLDPTDKYDGPLIGTSKGGGAGTLGGDGRLIVGIHGRLDKRTNKIEAISPVMLDPDGTGTPGTRPKKRPMK